jgi:two-component system, chemotaxis family, CheB/CheR fusion protein
MNIRDLVPESLREEAVDMAKRLGRAELLAPSCTRRITRDGRTLVVWMTATCLVSSAGEAYAIATTERATGSEEQIDAGSASRRDRDHG